MNNITKYVKKPALIFEAIQYTGDNIQEVINFIEKNSKRAYIFRIDKSLDLEIVYEYRKLHSRFLPKKSYLMALIDINTALDSELEVYTEEELLKKYKRIEK